MAKKVLQGGALDDLGIEAGTGKFYTKNTPAHKSVTVISGDNTSPLIVIEGPRGAPGEPGASGLDGNTVLGGAADPTSEVGRTGDFYLNTSSGIIYGPKLVVGWPSTGLRILGDEGAAGLPGTPGVSGNQGIPGINGKTILHSAGDPVADTGTDGDFFINTTTRVLWGPKFDGAWWFDDSISLVGAEGPQGPKGEKGDSFTVDVTGTLAQRSGYDDADNGFSFYAIDTALLYFKIDTGWSNGTPFGKGDKGNPGNTVLSGNGAPISSQGVDGDFYLDKTNFRFYGPKTAGAWGSFFSVVGPRGPTGPAVVSMPAENVTYGNTTVAQILDSLLYVPPVVQSLTATVAEAEKGQSIASQTISWVINKDITSQSINGSSMVPALRSRVFTGPFTTDTSWVLQIGDGTRTVNSTATLVFKSKRYWGVSSSASLSDAAIIALNGELTSSKSKSVIYDATGGKYIYYCYPASLGAPSGVTVGGLAFSDFTATTRSLVNAQGFSASYYVIRLNNIQTGSSIQVNWS